MRIQRVRPKWDEGQLASIYAAPHDHRIYGMGHHLRVEVTKVIAAAWATKHGWRSVGDLSCGNADIARSLGFHEQATILGDYAPGYRFTGPLEQTLLEMPDVDGYVCSETIEHLDEPELALLLIRQKAGTLILSTPLEAWDDSNGEHYWAWDRAGVERIMDAAGWAPAVFATVDTRVFGEPYQYGIWAAV